MFPWLTVQQNLMFGLTGRGDAEKRELADHYAEMVGLKGFENAYHPEILKPMREIPLARPGTPREVANAVCFMASPAASYVTGEVLYVAARTALEFTEQRRRPRTSVVPRFASGVTQFVVAE